MLYSESFSNDRLLEVQPVHTRDLRTLRQSSVDWHTGLNHEYCERGEPWQHPQWWWRIGYHNIQTWSAIELHEKSIGQMWIFRMKYQTNSLVIFPAWSITLLLNRKSHAFTLDPRYLMRFSGSLLVLRESFRLPICFGSLMPFLSNHLYFWKTYPPTLFICRQVFSATW